MFCVPILMCKLICYLLDVVPGASVSQINTEGETPLTHAECANHDEIVKLLQNALKQEGGKVVENEGEPVCECMCVRMNSCV